MGIFPLQSMAYTLAPLPYDFAALEPFISGDIMHVHYEKHHQAYCDNTNKALAGTALEGKSIEEVLENLSQLPEDKRSAVRNQAGGYFNHTLFWNCMKPQGGGKPAGDLLKVLEDSFGSFESFQEKFTAAAMSVFGSGWAWLVAKDGKLQIVQTPNQDSPVSQGMTPLFAIDVWEHAYYLQYKNLRADYVKAFWNVADWDGVGKRLIQTK